MKKNQAQRREDILGTRLVVQSLKSIGIVVKQVTPLGVNIPTMILHKNCYWKG